MEINCSGHLSAYLLNSIPFACYLLDLDGNFVYLNSKAELFFQQKKENILGKYVWEVFPESIPTHCYTAINAALAGKETEPYEYISAVNGSWISLTALPAENGGAIVLFSEIDELKTSRNQYQTLIENTPDTISRWNSHFRLLYANEVYTQKTGRTLEKILGMTQMEIGQSPEVALPWMEKMNEVFASNQAQEHYHSYPGPYGELFYFCKMVPEFDAQGRVESVLCIDRDITTLKKVEQELEAQTHFTQSILDTLPDIIALVHLPSGKLEYINNDPLLLLGFTREEMISMDSEKGIDHLVHADDIQTLSKYYEQVSLLNDGETTQIEYRAKHKNGTYVWLNLRGTIFRRNEQGEPSYAFHIWQDVTHKKNAENAIRENAALINSIADSAPDMVYAIDLVNRKQIYSNYKIAALLNMSSNQIRHLDISFYDQFIHPEDQNNFYNNLEELRNEKDKKGSELTYRLVDSDGHTHWIRTRRSVYKYDESGYPSHIVGVSEDITEQRELQERNHQLWLEHNEAKKQQRQEIFRVTLKVQEEERKRISETLHNGIGQILYAIKLTLDRMKTSLNKEVLAQQKILAEAQELLTNCIKESRRISHELMPPALEDFGLKAALEDVCWQLRGEVIFNCHFSGDSMALDKYIQLSVYRMVQELMINIIKHSHATHAVVRIVVERKSTRIHVEDNGKGFIWSEVKNKGIGLSTIRAKVKLLNGTTEINSDDLGTRVQITLPIELSTASIETMK